MKDIKSMTIGFLLATSMFLFYGQTSNEMYVTTSDNGRYQAFYGKSSPFLLDTKTGEMYTTQEYSDKKWISNVPEVEIKPQKW